MLLVTVELHILNCDVHLVPSTACMHTLTHTVQIARAPHLSPSCSTLNPHSLALTAIPGRTHSCSRHKKTGGAFCQEGALCQGKVTLGSSNAVVVMTTAEPT